jgi:hypothetical protein
MLGAVTGTVGLASLAGCSLLDSGGSNIPLYIDVTNENDHSHTVSIVVTEMDSDETIEKTYNVPPRSETELEKVGKFPQSREENVSISASTESSMSNTDSFKITGVEFYVLITVDGGSISFDSGHGDA